MENTTQNRIYEVSVLVRSDIAEDIAVDVFKKIGEYIAGNANILAQSHLDKIDLAYEIKKDIDNKKERFTESYFGFIKFKSTPEFIKNLQEKLDLTKELIRFLIVKTIEENTMLQKREKRNDDKEDIADEESVNEAQLKKEEEKNKEEQEEASE